MNAKSTKINEFFQGRKQHIIPIHQRKYSWTKNEECKQLFDDILTSGQTPLEYNEKMGEYEEIPHYLGAIVYKDISKSGESLIKRVVEDGQQRITTLTLMVLAMVENIKKHPKACAIKDINNVDQLLEDYVINPYSKGEEYYKLILNESDKNDLKELIDMIVSGENIDSKKIKLHNTSNIFSNFNFFRSKINKNNINDLYQGLLRLQIIEIYLERYDIDQVIYETLNSTGKSLSIVDRVRNYLLMGLPPEEQTELYEHYWRSMEILFEEYNPIYFDRFIRYYCIMKLKRGVKTVNVYRDFKKLTNNYKDATLIVKELYKYAKYFINIHFDEEDEGDLKYLFKDFSESNPMEFSPFLLKVYDEYENGKISKEEFVKVIKLLDSYLMRRGLCGLSGNTGSDGTVVRIMRVVDMDDLVNSFSEFLLSIKGNLRFLSDETVRETLMNKDFCLFKRNRFVLNKLANEGKNTHVDFSDLKIVRLKVDSDIDEMYLTKIGNLTLEEIDLCMDVDAKSDEEFIDKRSELLIDKIIDIWGFPVIS